MNVLHLLKHAAIHQGLREYAAESDAVLLDVRTRREYAAGHVPGSINLPLQELQGARALVSDLARPLYVYCHSGARSRQASDSLREMGYLSVKNIGGITGYAGPLAV